VAQACDRKKTNYIPRHLLGKTIQWTVIIQGGELKIEPRLSKLNGVTVAHIIFITNCRG
jgi:hypothetical protein